jgi:hypothetical protein
VWTNKGKKSPFLERFRHKNLQRFHLFRSSFALVLLLCELAAPILIIQQSSSNRQLFYNFTHRCPDCGVDTRLKIFWYLAGIYVNMQTIT